MSPARLALFAALAALALAAPARAEFSAGPVLLVMPFAALLLFCIVAGIKAVAFGLILRLGPWEAAGTAAIACGVSGMVAVPLSWVAGMFIAQGPGQPVVFWALALAASIVAEYLVLWARNRTAGQIRLALAACAGNLAAFGLLAGLATLIPSSLPVAG